MPVIEKSADHAGGRLRLGREDGVLVQARGSATIWDARPGVPYVQLSVHFRVPAQSRVEEVDSDLRVVDPPGGAGVLALDADGVRALLHVPGLVDHQHCTLVVQMLQVVLAHSSRTASASHRARPSRCCMPSGVASPAHSAMFQQFLRGRSDSSPSIRSRTRRRGSPRGNRSAIRLFRPSNAPASGQWPTPRPAAIARSLVFTHRLSAVAAAFPQPTHEQDQGLWLEVALVPGA